MSYQNRAGTEIHSFYALSCNVQTRLSVLKYISVSDCFTGCYYENTCAYQNSKQLFLRNLCIWISLCLWYHFVSSLHCFSCKIRLPLESKLFYLCISFGLTSETYKCNKVCYHHSCQFASIVLTCCFQSKEKANNSYVRYENKTVK